MVFKVLLLCKVCSLALPVTDKGKVVDVVIFLRFAAGTGRAGQQHSRSAQ
jgi:hypothetical protein